MLAVMFVACVAQTAWADDRIQVDAAVLAASESEDPESAGRVGYSLAVASWTGQVAGVLEMGEHDWAWDGGVSWIGLGARFALGEGKFCDRGRCLRAIPWLEVGAARESWTIDEPDLDATGARLRAHAGIGTHFAFTETFPVGMFVYFRVHRGQHADFVPMDDPWVRAPYDTSMVIGAGLVVGSYR